MFAGLFNPILHGLLFDYRILQGREQKCLPNRTPKPKFMETPNLACGLCSPKLFMKFDFELMASSL